jgi:xanthine dehydrogenase YagR molybdenum-binding subunit
MAAANDKYEDEVAAEGKHFRPLYDATIAFNGQPVALVVAEDPETARFAAGLVRVEYEQEPHAVDFEALRDKAEPGEHDHKRGDAARAFKAAPVRVEAEYRMPVEHHNPMEMFGTTVVWEGDGRLTIHDKTQGPQNCRNYVASVFGMPKNKVRVLSPYVGGAFGSGLRPQYPLPLAVLAALALKRSVQVTLTRQQMFTLG